MSYSGKGGKVPRYSCRGAHLNHGTERCISFGGLAADRAVEEEVLRALSPEAIRASLEGWEDLERGKGVQRRALELALEQAEYEARRAFRQYDRVEPENRLVASELERILEERLCEVERLRSELEELPEEKPLSEEEREALLSLSSDFPSLWHDERTDMAKKKRLVRTLIEEIYVDIDEHAALIHLTIRWAGGSHTELRVRKNRTGEHRHTTDRDTVELVRDLAKVASDIDIARILNRLGKRTGKGNAWTEGRIRSLRSYHRIEAFSKERKEREGWLNMAEAAAHLGVSAMSVRRLLEQGVISGKQVSPMPLGRFSGRIWKRPRCGKRCRQSGKAGVPRGALGPVMKASLLCTSEGGIHRPDTDHRGPPGAGRWSPLRRCPLTGSLEMKNGMNRGL